MSNNNTIFELSSLIVVLNSVTTQFIFNLPFVFIILGVIGFLGNVFTFLQPTLRYNTCCIYTLTGSFVDVLNLLINLPINLISQKYGIRLAWGSISSYCKSYIYFLGFFPQLSINLLVLSVIDRFACTTSLTSSLRQINKPKMAPWMILITIIITGITSLRAVILYDIIPNAGCSSTQPIINNVFYIIFNGALQPIIMVIFILLTYRNIIKSRQRVNAIETQNRSRRRNQFIIMIFIQVIATAFISLQWIIMYTYYLISGYTRRSLEQIFIEYFVFSLTNSLYYFNNVKSFYLSTLTCRLFRQIFIQSFLKLWFKLLGHRREELEIDGSTTNTMKLQPRNTIVNSN